MSTIKQKKLVPKLRFPSFKEEWNEKTLIEVAEIDPSTGPLPEHFIYIDLDSVEKGQLLKMVEISVGEAPSRAQRVLKKNDILFQTVRPYQQNNYFFNLDGAFVASTGYAQIRTSENPLYLYQYLHTQRILKGVLAKCTGTNYPAINGGDLQKITVLIPLYDEQQKVASFLTSVDECIENLKAQKGKWEEYKKGMMQKIFAQEIRFKDEKGKDFPDWEEKKFQDVFTTMSTKNFQIKNSEIFEKDEYPVVDQGADLIAGYSNDKKKLFRKVPVIVFGDHTTIIKYITFDFIVGADGTKLLGSKDKSVSLKFLYYAMVNDPVTPEGYKRHFSVLKTKKIRIPTVSEQQKITSFLTVVDELIGTNDKQVKKAEEWKKGLMQQMFV